MYIQRSGAERMTLEVALKHHLSEISPTKKPITQHADNRGKVPYRYSVSYTHLTLPTTPYV